VIRRSLIRSSIESSSEIDLAQVGGGRRRIDAQLLQRCVQDAERGQLKIRGALIVGIFSLAHQTSRVGMSFDDCCFTDGIDLSGATLPFLAVTNSIAKYLKANGVTLNGDLDLRHTTLARTCATSASTTVEASLWLCESQIGGRFLCRDMTLVASGKRAIHADRMHLGGTLRFTGQFTASGQIRMIGARIEGSVDLTGAQISEPYKGLCLDMADAHVDGTLFMIKDGSRRPTFYGRVDLSRARIAGRLHVADAQFKAPDEADEIRYDPPDVLPRCAFNARGLHVGGSLTMFGDTVVAGGMDLSQSDLGGLDINSSCVVQNPDRIVLDLANSVVRSALMIGSDPLTGTSKPDNGDRPSTPSKEPIKGTFRIRDARVEGAFVLAGTRWTNPWTIGDGPRARNNLLLAQGLIVLGDVDLEGAGFANGGINFRRASLNTVEASGAAVYNPNGDYAFNLNGAVLQGNLRVCEQFRCAGQFRLDRAQVAGMVNLNDAVLSPRARDGRALTAFEARVSAGMLLCWSKASGTVDFSQLRASTIVDNPDMWPSTFNISGMQYERLETQPRATTIQAEVTQRLRWLRGLAPFDIGAYQQLASLYARYGHRRQAQRILMKGRTRARRADVGVSRGWTKLISILLMCFWAPIDVLTGHGYRPQRVAVILAALVLAVFALVSFPPNQLLMRTTDADANVYDPYGLYKPTESAEQRLAHQRSCGNGAVRCFRPLAFAVDTVVPLISFGQASTWYVNEETEQGRRLSLELSFLALLGWLLASIFALSFARVLRE
jgi:uncharacterized protein YjbI with pentapeptide repeats